jgi:endonuclease/exonuclease/phosphatase family metal-dependent hydrolase
MKIYLLLLLIITTHLSMSQTVSVMTYNIRLDTKADGVNVWNSRKEKVLEVIQKNKPDILGVQEALHNQMMDLQMGMPDYAFVGVGRDDGKEKGEYSAIFYRKNKFEMVKQSTFWLSETPDRPGSKSWDAAITRIVTLAVLKEIASSKSFMMLNTHFDHIGQQARLNSAIFIKGLIKGGANPDSSMPVIISGDFNSTPKEPPYQNMINNVGIQLTDSRAADSKTGTFCGFEINAIECKTIDFIFHSTHWKTDSYRVIQDHDGKYYPSDHLPVLANLSVVN